ncbi:hypothetical protein ACOSQ4_022641 [Xanthoceras sorbifolium]
MILIFRAKKYISSSNKTKKPPGIWKRLCSVIFLATTSHSLLSLLSGFSPPPLPLLPVATAALHLSLLSGIVLDVNLVH